MKYLILITFILFLIYLFKSFNATILICKITPLHLQEKIKYIFIVIPIYGSIHVLKLIAKIREIKTEVFIKDDSPDERDEAILDIED